MYTTLSTGRVSKQRLPLTPLKSTSTNKRKRKTEVSEESSSDDDQQDKDYDDKYINRRLKQEGGSKRHNPVKEECNYGSQLIQALQMPLDTSKSPEELDFLIRLNTFMAERASTYPKLVWELREGKIYFKTFVKKNYI